MRTIQVRGKTGPDGVLHLTIPTETPDQEYDVVVNLQPILPDGGWPPGYFEEVAGSITDEAFFESFEKRPDEQAGP